MRKAELSTRLGFSLVEIMLVVTVIGILAIVAVPTAKRARTRTQNASFVNDLRILTGQVFEYYAMTEGDFPADVEAGILPAGTDEYMPKRFDWTEHTDIGGQWDWDRAENRNQKIYGCYAGVSVAKPLRTMGEMRAIDAMVDDGNLLTGKFRSRTDGYIYILQF